MSEFIRDFVAPALAILGSAFLLLGALGVIRMPDLYTRMGSGTKAYTLGIALMLLAVAAHFQTLPIITRAIAGVIFFFLTAPVSAHAIARAAHFVRVPLWEGTVLDELQDRYDEATHTLHSRDLLPVQPHEEEQPSEP